VHEEAELPNGEFAFSKGVLMRCMWLMENTVMGVVTGVAEARVGALRCGYMRAG